MITLNGGVKSMDGDTGAKWSQNLIEALKLIGILVAIVGGVFFGLFILIIILGFLFSIGLTLGLDNTTVQALTNVTNAFYAFVGQLTEGISLVGKVLLIVILLVVFGGLGYTGYQKIKALKSGGRSA